MKHCNVIRRIFKSLFTRFFLPERDRDRDFERESKKKSTSIKIYGEYLIE